MKKEFYGMYYGKAIFDVNKAIAVATARLLLLTANDPWSKYAPVEQTAEVVDKASELIKFALSD